jgi:uncharacterized protein involved in exopolysaccharide biosynthesis
MTGLSSREVLDRTIHMWWILVVLAILGGLAGWIFSKTRPPIYEANAVYEVMLDEQQLVKDGLVTEDKLPLQFAENDVYLSAAADIFYNPDVKVRVIGDAMSQGIPLIEKDFTSTNFNLDRRGQRWSISVRSTDPSIAAKLANIWLTVANSALLEARGHTSQSLGLGLSLDSVQKCFSELDFSKANLCAGTAFSSPAGLVEYLKNIQQQIVSEKAAGFGIYPALSFVITSPAQPPASPILYSASLIILAGSLLGLLAGVLVTRLLPASGHTK